MQFGVLFWGHFLVILAEFFTKNASKLAKNTWDVSKNTPIVFSNPNFI